MKRRFPPTPARRTALGLGLAFGLGLALARPAHAQSLVLEPVPVPSYELVCDDAVAPGPREPDSPQHPEVERLTNAATQAMLLGDLDGALTFLDRALRTDSAAIEATYLRARVLNQAGRAPEAIAAFCRLLALQPDGSSAAEARDQLDEARASEPAIAALYRAFERGVGFYGDSLFVEAIAEFTRVLDARPAAASALYNRGVARASAGQLALAREDLERHRALTLERPRSGVVADSRTVDQLIAWLDAESGGPSPGAALGLGVLLPGAGQFYTSRPVLGGAVAVGSVGALAAGFLFERVRIECRQVTPSGECPADQIASSVTERPLLLPAIGVAAAVWLAGAIEAALHARAARRPPASAQTAKSAVRLELRLDADVAELRVVVPQPSFSRRR